MRLKDKAKHYVKSKAKKFFKKLLIKLMIPYGAIILSCMLLIAIIFSMFQGTSSEGIFDNELSIEDNMKIQTYIENRVNDINNFETDYFAKDLSLRVNKYQIINYISYLNTYEENLPKGNIALINHYKKLADKAIEDLSPHFEYDEISGNIKKEYKAWIKDWHKMNGFKDKNGKDIKYDLTNNINKLNPSNYPIGHKIYDYANKKVYEVVDNSKKSFSLIGNDKPSSLANIMFLDNNSMLPDADTVTKDAMAYIISENKTYFIKENLETIKENMTETVKLLTRAVTFKNEYTYEYRIETEIIQGTADGTEEGKVEGDIQIEIKKPILVKENVKHNENFLKLKETISKINKDEDMDFVIALIEQSKDTEFNWLFSDGNNINLDNTLIGNDVPQEFMEYFNEVSGIVNVPSWLLASMAKHESDYDPKCVTQGPGGSAYGMMQIWQPDWENYYYNSGLNKFLASNGFTTASAQQAWDIFLSSPKVQILVGGWEINRYLNLSLHNYKIIDSNSGFNTQNMTLINWNKLNTDKQAYDIVGKGVAMYNGGPYYGWNADIHGNGMIATYVKRVLSTGILYGSNSAIVQIAMKYIGTPYLWGGSTPEQGGMDCSGFMQYIHNKIGVDITRTTYTQIDYPGFNSVPSSSMQAGDLIYFSYGSDPPHHVALYIGNNQFIHASGDEQDTTVSIAMQRGHKVMISQVNDYWKGLTWHIRRLKR